MKRKKIIKIMALIIFIMTFTLGMTRLNVSASEAGLNKKSVSLRKGSAVQLKIYGTAADSWFTSNPSVATVSGGKVCGKKTGKATITCKAKNGKKYKCQVYVTKNIDIKNYLYVMPEEFGGNLAKRLAKAVYPDNPCISYSDYYSSYQVGNNNAIYIGASTNNDGYMVWMTKKINNFSIYGIRIGMSTSEAHKKLRKEGLRYSTSYDNPIYIIDEHNYIVLSALNKKVTSVSFMCYLKGTLQR